jgi:hypothetical protein
MEGRSSPCFLAMRGSMRRLSIFFVTAITVQRRPMAALSRMGFPDLPFLRDEGKCCAAQGKLMASMMAALAEFGKSQRNRDLPNIPIKIHKWECYNSQHGFSTEKRTEALAGTKAPKWESSPKGTQ